MKKIILFFAVLCLMAAGVMAQTYTIRGEDFSQLTASIGYSKWCYYDINSGMNGVCGIKGAATDGAGAEYMGVNGTPAKYQLNIPAGDYKVYVSYADRTTHINPIVRIGNTNYDLIGAYSSYTEEVQPGQITLNGNENITLYAKQIGNYVGSKYISINYIKLQHVYCGDGIITGSEECDDGNIDNGDGCSSVCQIESVVSPEMGIIGLGIAVIVITTVVLWNKK